MYDLEKLDLLGNASTQVSYTHRKQMIQALKADTQDWPKEDELFKSTVPNVFGQDFEQMTNSVESVKLLPKLEHYSQKAF